MRITTARERLVLAFRVALQWRPTGVRLRALGRATLTSFLSVGGMLWLLPDLRASGPVSVLVLVLIVFGVGAVVRPLLVAVAVLFGATGLLLLGVVTQSLILQLAFTATPDIHSSGYLEIFVASWVIALIAAVVNWIFDVGSDDAFLARVVRHAARAARLDPHACTGPGVLIVQIDGLGADVMRNAVTAGALPTISSWLRSGSHTLRSWDTGLPATTPAGQAALLHGDTTVVPGFRWYEKSTRRMMVANRTRDAAEIEHRVSDGRGLLADGGVSVSNLLTGDAPTRLLTMSDPKLSTHARRGIGAYLAARGGLPRTVVLMIGEMITELQQGRRQRRRGVQPRVRRAGVFVLLRAVTTVLLRNLSVSLVADHLAAGAKVIFVDFVDYDEVAHHAGPSRAEALRTLDGIDRVLRVLAALARLVNRSYEIVVVSDHGQAQGATFLQQAGRPLDDLVAEIADVDPDDDVDPVAESRTDTAPAERWGPVNVLATTVARTGSAGGRGPARRALRGRTHEDGRSVTFGPARHDTDHPTARPIVAAGGSLAHVYLPAVEGRADVDRIALEHPRLLDGLRTHAQIGLVMVRLPSGRPAAFGATGWREVTASGPGRGEGDDPTAVYGPGAAAALAQLDTREHVGDLVVLGAYDPTLGEVTAFEELVGSHGGLGGGQNSAVLVTPTAWAVPGDRDVAFDGADVHRVLVDRLAALGLRESTVAPAAEDASPATERERAESAR